MVIGLTGSKESGKNTVASIIQSEYEDRFNVKEFSFAKNLKESACAALGIKVDDPIEFCDHLKETGLVTVEIEGYGDHGFFVQNITGRQYLQYYGTEAHREIFGTDFWIHAVAEEMEQNARASILACGAIAKDLFLITDVRFQNEAEAIRNFSQSMIIRVNRKEVETNDSHASEKQLPAHLIDIEIDNNGTMEELKETLILTIDKLLSFRPLALEGLKK